MQFFLKKRESKDFYSDKTEAVIPVVTSELPVAATQRYSSVMPDKDSQFVSMMNMLIKNRYAIVTCQFGDDHFRVLHMQTGNKRHTYVVTFEDFGGKKFTTAVSSFTKFGIFRGI